jgi:HAD superfamily hydrolase (TIGR01490 family)
MSRSAAAFFDLDKTLMEGSSALHWGRAARRAGVISRRQMLADGLAHLRYRLYGSTDEKTDELRERVYSAIAGQRVADLERLAPEVLAGILPRLYPEMLKTAWDHQDAGRPAYIVTSASQEIAGLLAQVLAFEGGGIGTRSEIEDGVYTGGLDGPFNYREGKAIALREVAEREGIDLSASYAYSDSESDLPMLRSVGHPVAVNPDSALDRVARDEDWEVIRFDKLGRRLRIAAAAGGVAVVGWGGGYLAGRLRERLAPPRRSRLPRLRGA